MTKLLLFSLVNFGNASEAEPETPQTFIDVEEAGNLFRHFSSAMGWKNETQLEAYRKTFESGLNKTEGYIHELKGGSCKDIQGTVETILSDQLDYLESFIPAGDLASEFSAALSPKKAATNDDTDDATSLLFRTMLNIVTKKTKEVLADKVIAKIPFKDCKDADGPTATNGEPKNGAHEGGVYVVVKKALTKVFDEDRVNKIMETMKSIVDKIMVFLKKMKKGTCKDIEDGLNEFSKETLGEVKTAVLDLLKSFGVEVEKQPMVYAAAEAALKELEKQGSEKIQTRINQLKDECKDDAEVRGEN